MKLSQTCNKTHKVSYAALKGNEMKFCPLNISFVSAGINTETQ